MQIRVAGGRGDGEVRQPADILAVVEQDHRQLPARMVSLAVPLRLPVRLSAPVTSPETETTRTGRTSGVGGPSTYRC